MKIYTFVDLKGNQVKNAVIDNLSSAPLNPKAGQIYFDTTLKSIFEYDGESWIALVADSSYVHTDNNFTTGEKDKLSRIEPESERNKVTDVRVDGVSVVDEYRHADISFADYRKAADQDEIDLTKVDKVEGKQLSTEDYTTEEKQKLHDIESGSQVNVIEVIKKNGTALTIDNKEVDIPIPTKTSDITNDSDFITQEEVITNNFPSGWRKSGSILNLITDINNDSTAITGKSYLSTVNCNDLPSGLVQGEMKVEVLSNEVGVGKVLLLTLTDSSTAPYHWEYTSVGGSTGTWRAFVEASQLGTAAYEDVPSSGDASSSQVVLGNDTRLTNDRNAADVYSWAKAATKPFYNYSEIGNPPTNVSDFTNDTGFVTASVENGVLILE